MDLEFIDQPIRFDLLGLSSSVGSRSCGEVGCGLMDAMWKIVKHANLRTTGINHWVYFADGRMFVGIELSEGEQANALELERCECKLVRYAKHVHVGPYHELPQKWQSLRAELSARGESVTMPSLEVYGHSCEGEDDSLAETTILIGLEPKAS